MNGRASTVETAVLVRPDGIRDENFSRCVGNGSVEWIFTRMSKGPYAALAPLGAAL